MSTIVAMDFTLKALFKDLSVRAFKGDWKSRVSSISTDSRRVVPGTLFFALGGLRTDGNYYVEEAIDRGACAIVSEQPFSSHGKIVYLQVDKIRSVLAEVARRFYRNPEQDLDLVGITGTNGKTTVSHLVRYLLQGPEHPVGMLGTIVYDLGQRTLPAYRTTPEPVDLYAMLAQMRDNACRHAVMEVSSHGIDQQRVDGLHFKVAAFLNLTRDHIDYHHSMEGYFVEKSRLFTGATASRPPEVAVINIDDSYGRRLRDIAQPASRLLTVGETPEADFCAAELALDAHGARFRLIGPEGGSISVSTCLLGRYNVHNLLAAFAICYALGHDPSGLASRVPDFPGVPGRMERVDAGQSFNVLVDYAHTDDALQNALTMLRTVTTGRLLVVFGCGGDRDRKKRPLMTQVVMEHADFVWATADNPRGESISTIFSEMKAGVIDPNRIRFVEERRRAISLALDECGAGDCLLIAGKGHETFQEFADSVTPFDDRLVARELLEIRQFVSPKLAESWSTASENLRCETATVIE